MKSPLVCVLLFFGLVAIAQKTETYYDYNWKPCDPAGARFFSTLEKTDSGWLRFDYFMAGPKLQMKALFVDSACTIYNGQSVFLHANGYMSSIGRRLHNKHEGVCMSFYSNGAMSDSASYHNGVPVGNKYSWWPNGILRDSVTHKNDSMDLKVAWFDNGQPSEAGYLLNGKLHGKWQFFHKNGQSAAIEMYDHGRLLSADYFKEDGSAQEKKPKDSVGAAFKGGNEGWQKYLYGRLYWPANYTFSNGDHAVVVVNITINEDGMPEDVEVVTPFHPAFDKIALDVIRKSPRWTPAMLHNRRVKNTFRQPVSFNQQE